MNEHSSRSHAIYTVTLECSENVEQEKPLLRQGKLHLVDLAVGYHLLFTYHEVIFITK